MTLCNIIYILCLGGIILSFCSIGFGSFSIPFLTDHMRCRLLHNCRVSLKINDDDDETSENDENGKEPTAFFTGGNSINVGMSENKDDLGFGRIPLEEDISNINRLINDQLSDASQLQNIGSALQDTLSTILKNNMLRKAFVEDLQGLGAMEALRNVFKQGVVVSPPHLSSSSTNHSNSDSDMEK